MKVFLSENDLEKITKKKIGQGREGKVYDVGNGLLYKLYYKLAPHEREKIVHVNLKEFEVDDDGVKRVVEHDAKRIDVEEVVPLRPYYVDYDGVKKVYSIDQIDEAKRKQPNIKLTSLPLGPIYINNRLGGVVLKHHKGYFNLHIISMLPPKARLKILRIVLEKLKELCDNNIYPIDYSNQTVGPCPHSNILINIKGDVQFIDLEGKSTMYTKEPSDHFKSLAYSEFYFLFLDIMYNEEIHNDYTEEDILYIESSLVSKGFNDKYIKYLRNWDNLDYDISIGLLDIHKTKAKKK